MGKLLLKLGALLLKWGGKALLWGIAHPVVAVAVGVGLLVASRWLDDQPWMGSDVLSSVVHTAGSLFLVTAVGSWLVAGPWQTSIVKRVTGSLGAVGALWLWAAGVPVLP